MLILTLVLIAVLYVAVGVGLAVFVFSEFPFVDSGPLHIFLWPVVLFTCFGWWSLLFDAVVVAIFYGIWRVFA